jgi:CheY-like chemotaxis protein
VDDEPDILETLQESLDECELETASNYESARRLLETKQYDAAILDIMGVQGLDLLQITTEKQIPTLMLTAHALNPDSLVGSITLGAKAYVPKDKLFEIDLYLTEIFVAKMKGIERSGNWFARLEPLFDKEFGPEWKKKDKPFWDEFQRTFVVSKDELQEMM